MQRRAWCVLLPGTLRCSHWVLILGLKRLENPCVLPREPRPAWPRVTQQPTHSDVCWKEQVEPEGCQWVRKAPTPHLCDMCCCAVSLGLSAAVPPAAVNTSQ